MTPGIRVAEAAWPEIEARLQKGALGVLPVGAAAKEHGRHMSMDTDYVQAEWLAGEVLRLADVVVWPTLSYGYYPVFVEYPGSTTIEETTFRDVVRDLLGCIFRAGARRAVILNTGISTIPALDAAVAASARPAHLVNVYAGPGFRRAVAAVQEQSWGGHADEIETSIMLALAPARVDMTRAAPAPVRIERGLFNRMDPAAPNYSPTGVNGDPSRATRAKGERITSAMLADVMAALAALQSSSPAI